MSAAFFFIPLISLVTATISGVFGMAGGIMLMGALALVLPVNAAFVTHGVLQLASNGWRTLLHRQYVAWRAIGFYVIGAAVAAVVMAIIAFTPSKPVLFLLLGILPFSTWAPERWFKLDASRPAHALAAGLSMTSVNLTAGVAGPLLDIFFIRTALTRHQIVATKAATQVFSHIAKIIVYGAPLMAAGGPGMPPAWVFAVSIALALVGAVAGGQVLNRLSDVNFKRYTRWIVTGVGIFYLVQAAQLWLWRG